MIYLLVFILFIVAVVLLSLKVDNYTAKRDTDKQQKFVEKVMEAYKPIEGVSAVPDAPVSFGYKITWIAVKTADMKKIAEVIGLKNVQECNWESGLAYAQYKSVFVSPAVGEWTLVVGHFEYGKVEYATEKKLLLKLSAEFGEAQYFGSHRVSDYYCWMKAENGKIARLYGTMNDGSTMAEGNPTEFEQKLNLFDPNCADAKHDWYWEREDLTSQDEDLVLELAESWSVNPAKLDQLKGIDGTGLLGVME